MDLGGEGNRRRMVGDYEIGPRIGSGSFAVVWKSRHRWIGTEFAIKEIDKKHLNESMMKEISILRRVNHPNIVRLFESIETEDRIYLVLEYCGGGDLGAYLHRHGRVSADVARHFMRQLAAGLHVLRANNLIHRDLKPQNLLLSSKEVTPSLKIGDFGFARYLTPQDLADTLCGSPLYMAPEIIQNQKYDAKADLWSVGAILFQLVTGRPPYGGNSQHELFQNILSSSEPKFPPAALQALHPDCVELCKRLLRRNPVERLTFEEFFNHKFLVEPRVTEEAGRTVAISRGELLVERTECLRDNAMHQNRVSPSNEKNLNLLKDHSSLSSTMVGGGSIRCTTIDTTKPLPDADPQMSYQHKVVDSMESIEREYVLVNSHFASVESLTSSLERTLIDSSGGRACGIQTEMNAPAMFQMKDVATGSTGGMGKTLSTTSNVLLEGQGTGAAHYSSRLRLLNQYARALSILAQDKLNTGLLLESFSVELSILAIWEEILRISRSWLASSSPFTGETVNPQGAGSCSGTRETFDFSKPSACLVWAENGFIDACKHAEKLAKEFQETEGTALVPNATDLIYEAGLASGRCGAVEELMENRDGAATSYSKAIRLLSFIVSEASLLPLKPPFSLHPEDKKRVLNYIRCLESHRNRLRAMQQRHPEQPSGTTTTK